MKQPGLLVEVGARREVGRGVGLAARPLDPILLGVGVVDRRQVDDRAPAGVQPPGPLRLGLRPVEAGVVGVGGQDRVIVAGGDAAARELFEGVAQDGGGPGPAGVAVELGKELRIEVEEGLEARSLRQCQGLDVQDHRHGAEHSAVAPPEERERCFVAPAGAVNGTSTSTQSGWLVPAGTSNGIPTSRSLP